MTLAGIFIGGGLGAMLRFWLGNVITAKTKGLSLPIGILTVNILGGSREPEYLQDFTLQMLRSRLSLARGFWRLYDLFHIQR